MAKDPQVDTTFLKVNLTVCIKSLKIILPFNLGNGISHFWRIGDLRVGQFLFSLFFSVFPNFSNWKKRKLKKAIPMLLSRGLLHLKCSVIIMRCKNHNIIGKNHGR